MVSHSERPLSRASGGGRAFPFLAGAASFPALGRARKAGGGAARVGLGPAVPPGAVRPLGRGRARG